MAANIGIHPISFQQAFKRPFTTLVLAGGGNRCWWQAGVMQHLAQNTPWEIKEIIAASAGAAIATAFLLNETEATLAWCRTHFAQLSRNVEWKNLRHGESIFSMARLYPAWLNSFLTDDHFLRLKQSGTTLKIAITRPLTGLPISVASLLALTLYSSNKFISGKLHSPWPRRFGFRAEYLSLTSAPDAAGAIELLLASAAAVPITKSYRIKGKNALDGGFFDSIPLPQAQSQEKSAQTLSTSLYEKNKSTLILMTRYRHDLPQIFTFNGCTYWQPSQKLQAKNFDCTNPSDIMATFNQGLLDAQLAVTN